MPTHLRPPPPQGRGPRVEVGGQALPGGVVMCGASAWALAVRDPRTGAIEVTTVPRTVRRGRPVLRMPVVRGVAALAEGLAIGAAAQRRAAPGAHPWTSVAAGLLLFFVAPALVARVVAGGLGSGLGFALVEGAIRAALLVLALLAAGRLPWARRAFAHHGAEHQAVAWHEAGLPPSGAAALPRFHARCGTGLAAMALLVAVPVLAPLGVPGTLELVASRLLAIPLIAGLAFEVLRWAGGRARAHVLLVPGLWLQRLTTREPGPAELAVAVAALDAVLAPDRAGRHGAVRLAA